MSRYARANQLARFATHILRGPSLLGSRALQIEYEDSLLENVKRATDDLPRLRKER
jgi:DNA-directed RNA polymerase subunit K/omega